MNGMDSLSVKEIINGERVFEYKGKDYLVPTNWSDTAVRILIDKYMGINETSAAEVFERIATEILNGGINLGYFNDQNGNLDNEKARIFYEELIYILAHQLASFNSPVWFNCGLKHPPQVSACFILDIDDNMESILDYAKTEAKVFTGGSGAGANFSKLRGEGEPLSGGGTSSGPLPFLAGFDKISAAIKSGGRTRRAAKIAILDVDHPDIEKFINCKVNEEEKAKIL